MRYNNLNSTEIKQLTKLCERVHYTQSNESFCNHLYIVLKQAIPSIHFTIDHFSLAPLTLQKAINNSLPSTTFEHFKNYMHQHPGIIQHRESQKIFGSLLTELEHAQYRKSELYNEVYRAVNIEDQIWMGIGDQEELIGISFSRDTVYTEQEVLLLALIQPQVSIALKNWKRIRALEKQLNELKSTPIKSEEHAHLASAMRASIPLLSPRQRQVVELVATGKTNLEIATELKISPRTVGKHLEQIFTVFNVRTRTALAHASGLINDIKERS